MNFPVWGKTTARNIITLAGKLSDRKLSNRSHPKHTAHVQAVALHMPIQRTRVLAPRTDCIVPICETRLLEGLHKELEADFFTVATRPAKAYRGNPFQVEVAIAYGRPGGASVEVDQSAHTHKKVRDAAEGAENLAASKEEPIHLLLFANRVPLLYQQASCAITRAVTQMNWRIYGLHQPKGALPVAPMTNPGPMSHPSGCPTHRSPKRRSSPIRRSSRRSSWACNNARDGSRNIFIMRLQLRQEYDRRTYIEKYLPHIGIALQEILALSDSERDSVVGRLDDALHKSRAMSGAEP